MLTVVLETHPTKQLLYKYKDTDIRIRDLSGKRNYIRFEKDNKSNHNPAVSIWILPIVTNSDVEFDSVDIIETLIQYYIAKEKYDNDTDSRLRLRITDAIVTTSYWMLFVSVDNVEIIIKNCHFKQTKSDMPYGFFYSNNHVINLTMENTILEGRLVTKMVGGIAHFKNCTFKDTPVRPDTSLLDFRDSQVTVDSCRFSNIFLQNVMPLHKFNNESEKVISPKQNAFVITGNMCNSDHRKHVQYHSK